MQRVNHLHFSLWRTTGDDQRQSRKSVDFVVGHGVKLLCSLDEGGLQFIGHVGRKDAYFARNGRRSGGMVPGEHVDADAGGFALAHRPSRLCSRWIVNRNESEEHHVDLEVVATPVLPLREIPIQLTICNCEYTLQRSLRRIGNQHMPGAYQALARKHVHFAQDGLLGFVIQCSSIFVATIDAARVKESLYCTLRKDVQNRCLRLLVHDGHTFHVAVERKFEFLTPSFVEPTAPPRVETVSEDLERYFRRLSCHEMLALTFVEDDGSDVAE